MSALTAERWVAGEEGIFTGLPAESYHAAPGVSHSMLKNIEPPARLPVYLTEKREVTSAMILGTLTHSLILEPGVPLPMLAIKPDGMKFSTTEGKLWKAKADAEKRIIIKEDEHAALHGMVKAVAEHDDCRDVFAEGDAEVSLFKLSTLDGRTCLCKARMDFIPTGNALADIKTCMDASEEGFGKTLYDSGYFTQAAYYLDIYNAAKPADEPEKAVFVFIAVEKFPPYLVKCYTVHPLAIADGREVNAKRLTSYMECAERKFWPGFKGGFTPIDIPGWARARLQNAAHADWKSQLGQIV